MQHRTLLAFFATLLAHIQFSVHKDPQVLFFKDAFQFHGPQCALVPWVIRPQVQDFAVLLVELHAVPVSPFLQSMNIPLNGNTTLWYIKG